MPADKTAPHRKPEHPEIRSARTAVSAAADALAAAYSNPKDRPAAQAKLSQAHRALDAAIARNPS